VLSVAITGLLLACTWGGTTYPWDSPEVLVTGLGGLALTAVFIAIERRVEEPLLPLVLFRDRVFSVSTGGGFVIGAIIFAVSIYVPVFSQCVQNISATSSGVVLVPFSLGWVVAATLTGQLISRTGRYRPFPIVGGVFILAGLTLLALIGEGTPPAAVGGILVITGIGMGMSFQPYIIATQNAVEVSNLWIATATIQFFRRWAGASRWPRSARCSPTGSPRSSRRTSAPRPRHGSTPTACSACRPASRMRSTMRCTSCSSPPCRSGSSRSGSRSPCPSSRCGPGRAATRPRRRATRRCR
jgi:hypothetical protein